MQEELPARGSIPFANELTDMFLNPQFDHQTVR